MGGRVLRHRSLRISVERRRFALQAVPQLYEPTPRRQFQRLREVEHSRKRLDGPVLDVEILVVEGFWPSSVGREVHPFMLVSSPT